MTAAGMLNAKHIEQFRTQGYCIVPDFFPQKEVRALQTAVKMLKAQGKLRNVRTEADGQAAGQGGKQNLQLCPASPHSPIIKALPFDEKVIAAVTSLIGPQIILHLDQIFLKPGLRGSGTNWHQDNAYFKIKDPMQGTAMWIAVDDATIANGTMRVIPNQFSQLLEHTRDPESDHHIRCYPDEMQSVAVEVPAGGVAFFCYGTPHCTMGNNTLADRAGLALHFLTYEAARTGEHHEQFKPGRDNRPALTGPDATWGQTEYKMNMQGVFAKLVDELNELDARQNAQPDARPNAREMSPA